MAGLTTSALRRAWHPPCKGPWAKVPLHGGAVLGVRPSIVEAVQALNRCFQRWDYRATFPDCGCYNCRKITGGEDWSLHAFSIALDINWQQNPYGRRLVTDMPLAMIEAIEAIRSNNGKVVWRWGGRYSGNKDAMHLEVVCTPSDLATGINWRTVVGLGVVAPPKVTSPIMRVGMTGSNIAFIQHCLNIIQVWQTKAGNPLGNGQGLTTDGKFGRSTYDLVLAYEKWYRERQVKAGMTKGLLAADGVVTGPTCQAIGIDVKAAQKALA